MSLSAESKRNPIAWRPAPALASAARPSAERSLPLWRRAVPLIRYRLLRLGGAGLIGLALSVAAFGAGIVLLLPMRLAMTQLRAELAQAPSHPLGVGQPQQDIRQFLNSLPSREQVPALLTVLITQATGAGVALDQGRYSYSPPTSTRLARYLVEFPIKGDYATVRNFIDRSLKEVPALGLNSLHVERPNVADIVVSANVGFVIYLRDF